MAILVSNGTIASINSLYAGAADGDIITIPTGNFSWATTSQAGGFVFFNRGISITLQGNTTISGDHTTFHTTPPTVVDNTILTDTGSADTNRKFIHATVPAGSNTILVRITGISFTGPGGQKPFNGAIHFSSSNANARFRFDHCHMYQQLNNNSLGVYDGAYGVEDHCVYDNLISQSSQHQIKNGIGRGDDTWTQ